MKATVSGIRGVFGADLRPLDVITFCNAFAEIAGVDCVMARDTRPSGTMLSSWAAAALMQNGINVHDLGVAATPVAFRESRQHDAGLVLTSSHNPIEWNGLKFALGGRGINSEEIRRIVGNAAGSKLPQDATVSGSSSIGSYEVTDSSYVDDAVRLVGEAAGSPEVLIDAGGGAGASTAMKLLESIGCRVRIINEMLQGSTRGPDPTTDPLDDLVAGSRTVDIGFAFDLDGDRLVLVKDGRKLPPDVTLALGVAKAIDMGCNRFVLSVDTSTAVEWLIKQGGGQVKRSKVGEANVVDAMIKTGAQAGGEGSSAGFILPSFNHCRDGLLVSGLVASMLDGPHIDEVISLMGRYHQVREKVETGPVEPVQILDGVVERMAGEYSEIIEIDGVKAITDDGSWVLLRGSNTENAIRISAESDSPERARSIVSSARRAVQQHCDV